MARRDGSRPLAPEAEPSCRRRCRAALCQVTLADGEGFFEWAAEQWPALQWIH
jgi:hypothetical protein